MDFTELYQQSNGLVAFSNGAHWVLNAVQDRIIVRRADTFAVTRTWVVDATPSATNASFGTASSKQTAGHNAADLALVSHIGWSADSEFVLAACARHGVVNIYKMRDEEWSARIEAGVEGLTRAEWAPDGRSVLCFSEWGVRFSFRSFVFVLFTGYSGISASGDHLVPSQRFGHSYTISKVPRQRSPSVF